jgi:hypothetical protein
MITLIKHNGFIRTIVLTVILLYQLQSSTILYGQVSTSPLGLTTANGFHISNLSLTGNPFFPPTNTTDRTLFTADNRRLYILSPQSLGFIPFPRRIQGSLEQLDPFIDDISFVRLTNNTYHLVNSQGVLTRNLSEEQFSQLRINHRPNTFLLAPGGFSIQSDGTLSLLNSHGISWADIRILNRRINSIVKILSPTQILVSIGSNTLEPTNQLEDQTTQVGLIQFFSTNRPIIPGERLVISGALARSTNISARLFIIPKSFSQNLAGFIFDSQTTHPWQIITLQNQRIVRLENLITQETREFLLPDLVGQIQECVFLDQNLYCRTSAWQLIKIDFLTTHFFHIPTGEVAQLISNHIQALRGIQNSFQEALLENPSDFSRYLNRLRDQEKLTIEQINGLYRIYSYPLRTGQFLIPTLRLEVLDILSKHNLTTSELLVFAHLLRFEYDVQAGIDLIKLMENQFWPILYTHRVYLHQFILRRASQFQYDHLEYLVSLYQRLQSKLLPQSIAQLFPEHFWTGLLVHQSSQRNRNLILSR